MTGCCSSGDTAQHNASIRPMTVTLDYLEFPPSYTFHGGNQSPSLMISGLEPEVVSLVVMVFNPFIKSCCSFTTWIIWNIPPMYRIPAGIPSGPVISSPVVAIQGINDYGETGYHGPEPSPGEMHRYQFRVYALDSMLQLSGGESKETLISAMQGHVMQYGETVAIARG